MLTDADDDLDLDPSRVEEINATFPPKLIGPLFSKARYRVFYGGRGGSKSWSIARALLLQGLEKPLRILCLREFQSSISDSVHKLLQDQIFELGLSDRYTVEKSVIYGTNGTEFRFAGLRNNPSAVKSYEAIDVAYVEEAANVSKSSWAILIPTIRKLNSQIIVAFNPELESDDTYQRFVVNPPPGAVVVKINWMDNPWFPEALKDEAEYMEKTDPDGYRHIYLGYPKVYLDDAVYAAELRRLQAENRLTKVRYDPLVPVHCFYDLGWRDATAIILAQVVGQEFHVIDYIEGTQKSIVEYLKILQAKQYIYGTDYVPHDAVAKELGSGRSIIEIMRSNGRHVQVVPRMGVNDGINAARVIFDRVWIDETKCADLMQNLRKYCWDTTGAKPVPLHDDASHAADAFRSMAIALRAPKAAPRLVDSQIVARAAGWMS